ARPGRRRARAAAGSPATSSGVADGGQARLPVRSRHRHASAPAPVSSRVRPGSTRSALAALLDAGLLAPGVAEVVQLRAADVTADHDLDLLEDRRVKREGALDPDAEGDLPDREGPSDAVPVDTQHDPLEDLD